LYFILGIYEGGNRYHAVFEKLADFSELRSGERNAAVEAAIRRYAGCWRGTVASTLTTGLIFSISGGVGMGSSRRWWRARRGLLGVAMLGVVLGTGAAQGMSAAAGAAPVVAAIAADGRGTGPVRVVPTADVTPSPELDELMSLLARRQHGHVTFVEEHFLAVLDKPVESSGELLYDAPDHLEKRTLKPKPETLVLEHGVITAHRGKRTYVLNLSDYPQIVPLIDSIRATWRVIGRPSSVFSRSLSMARWSIGRCCFCLLTPPSQSRCGRFASKAPRTPFTRWKYSRPMATARC